MERTTKKKKYRPKRQIQTSPQPAPNTSLLHQPPSNTNEPQTKKKKYVLKQKEKAEVESQPHIQSHYFEEDTQSTTYAESEIVEKHQKEWPRRDQRDFRDHDSNCHLNEILKNSHTIQRGDRDMDDKIKILKKLFCDKIKAEKVEILASKDFPAIVFKYELKGITQHKLLKDFFRENKEAKTRRELYSQIFDNLFHKVSKPYYSLAVFAIEKAKRRKIPFLKINIFNVEEGTEVMFYYMVNQAKQSINFIIYDRNMNYMDFKSEQVIQYAEDHPDQFQLFRKFQQKIIKKQKKQEEAQSGLDLFDNQEVQSDDDDRMPNFEEESIQQLQKDVDKIMNKNLSELQDEIQKLNDDFNAESSRNPSSPRLTPLGDKIEELQKAKDAFEMTRNIIIGQRRFQAQPTKMKMKSWLKKMIIAEKQLQSRLPIISRKKDIFSMLSKHNLLVIEGETGSGKSTQLPQILAQFYQLFDDQKARPVLVTQPRRLATRTLAERVAKEMGQNVGGFVDYQASAGKKVNPQAKIIFKLDRLVLDEITQDRLLSKYSCLVIDEAHERTISIDVILGLVKQLLSKRHDFKVIVTSASMNTALFEQYFKTSTIKVSGRMYPVEIIYKEYAEIKEGVKNYTGKKVIKLIDEQILTPSLKMKDQYKGHLLCFCSNLEQINFLTEYYTSKLNPKLFVVFALHGKINPIDQKKIFDDTHDMKKFIFASRIAETAITIDGVKVVIDPGEDYELVYDQKYKVASMKLINITQSSAKQRAGRSGRTGPGYCFRIYSEESFKSRKMHKLPQIENSSLETVVLRLKTLKINEVVKFPYISPPNAEGLEKSLDMLKLIGALDGKTQSVTSIGKLLIKIPIEPFLSRAIIESMIFQKLLKNDTFRKKLNKIPLDQMRTLLEQGVKKPVISILCMVVNFSSLFFVKKEEREAGEKNKFQLFSDQEGDFFFLQNIFRDYVQLKAVDETQRSSANRNPKWKYQSLVRQWTRKNYLSEKALAQVQDLIHEISKIVEQFAVNDKEYEAEIDQTKVRLAECTSYREVILSCLISSFSSNLCRYSGNPRIGYTMMNQMRPLQIYGTSNLNLLGITSNWIVCYDLYTNEQGNLYCKVAQQVKFQFLKKHLSSYIWKTFQVDKIQKFNPIYSVVEKQLPTRIIQQIKSDLRSFEEGKDKSLAFLSETFPMIVDGQNKVSLYILNKKKSTFIDNIIRKLSSKQSKEEEIETKVYKYLEKIEKKERSLFRHNYIGSIHTSFKEGFEIDKIQFNSHEFCVQIIGKSNIISSLSQQFAEYGSMYIENVGSKEQRNKGPSFFTYFQENQKLKIIVASEETKKLIMQELQFFKNVYSMQIQIKESLVDKRRKIPQARILLHFYAGECQKDNLLLSYPDYSPQTVQEFKELIYEGVLKYRLKRLQSRFTTRLKKSFLEEVDFATKFKLTKKGNGINLYRLSVDQYELAQELFRLDKQGYFGFGFKMPKNIVKFRHPDHIQATKSDETWKKQITALLKQAKQQVDQNLIINVRGYYKPLKDADRPLGGIQQKLRVNMNAEIITYNNRLLSVLQRQYDGRKGVLGCQKLHVRAAYDQVLATPASKAFDYLKSEYNYQKELLKVESPMLLFIEVPKRVRNKEVIMIIGKSPNKEDFLKPQRIINELFSPKLLKLQFSQFRFLDKMTVGQNILDDMEEEYEFKIYFSFQRYNHTLKIYCHESLLKQIQQKLKEKIKQYKYYTQQVSYRGKNLKKVNIILEEEHKRLNVNGIKVLQFQILFQKRSILLTADITTFEIVKNKIQALANSQKGQCLICCEVMKNPYRLLNCPCAFCWNCLADHLRTFRNSPSQILYCPNDDCKRAINMNDVSVLLSQEQFQKMCDLKVNLYVQKNTKAYTPCKFCQNIFLTQEIQKDKSVNCEICGQFYCFRCKEPHKNYSCEEWEHRNDKEYLKKQLAKIGVKQCPQCSTGIQKNGGCLHITCTSCKSHICWKCLKIFATEKQVYDHLVKDEGGIFDEDEAARHRR